MGRALDRDRAVDESGNQIAVFGRVGARPLSVEEQQKMYLRERPSVVRERRSARSDVSAGEKMKTGIDPKVDYAFKKVFGVEANTPLLSDFVNAVVATDTAVRRIGDPQSVQRKRCRGREAERARHQGTRRARPAVQHRNADVRLPRTLASDTILLGGPPQQPVARGTDLQGFARHDLDRHRELCAVPSGRRFSSGFSATLLTVSGSGVQRASIDPPAGVAEVPQSATELTDALDRWCYFLAHGEELDSDQLPETLNNPAVRRAMEVLNVLSQSDIERERYQARLKWERDQHAYIDDGANSLSKRGMKKATSTDSSKGSSEDVNKGYSLAVFKLSRRCSARRSPLEMNSNGLVPRIFGPR